LAIPKSGFKERRRPSSAAEIAAVSVRDNLFWVRPPSRQVLVIMRPFICVIKSLRQLPPPEALHLNAPRKQDDSRCAGLEEHGPERRRSNSAIGMYMSSNHDDSCRLTWFLRVSASWSSMFDALKVAFCSSLFVLSCHQHHVKLRHFLFVFYDLAISAVK
jgi:hypothetical protein